MLATTNMNYSEMIERDFEFEFLKIKINFIEYVHFNKKILKYKYQTLNKKKILPTNIYHGVTLF